MLETSLARKTAVTSSKCSDAMKMNEVSLELCSLRPHSLNSRSRCSRLTFTVYTNKLASTQKTYTHPSSKTHAHRIRSTKQVVKDMYDYAQVFCICLLGSTWLYYSLSIIHAQKKQSSPFTNHIADPGPINRQEHMCHLGAIPAWLPTCCLEDEALWHLEQSGLGRGSTNRDLSGPRTWSIGKGQKA